MVTSVTRRGSDQPSAYDPKELNKGAFGEGPRGAFGESDRGGALAAGMRGAEGNQEEGGDFNPFKDPFAKVSPESQVGFEGAQERFAENTAARQARLGEAPQFGIDPQTGEWVSWDQGPGNLDQDLVSIDDRTLANPENDSVLNPALDPNSSALENDLQAYAHSGAGMETAEAAVSAPASGSGFGSSSGGGSSSSGGSSSGDSGA